MLRRLMVEKLALQNVPAASLKLSMRDFFLDLVDLTIDETGKSCLKSIPTNYGYTFFWYGNLNKKALSKHYAQYVPKERAKELKQGKRLKDGRSLQSQISEFLFNIVRDNTEVVGEGIAEVHLAIIAPKLRQATVADASKMLKAYSLQLEKLEAFTGKSLQKKNRGLVESVTCNFETIDYITDVEVARYSNEYFWDDECGYVELAHRRLGCEIQVNVPFGGDEKLGEIIDRIETIISQIKAELTPMSRLGKSRWPF